MTNVKEETVVHAAPTSPAATTEFAHPRRGRTVAVIVAIGMFVLGLLGGWALTNDGDDSATWGGEIDQATLDEIDELLADYWSGWDAGDGDAVVAVMTSDGWFSSVNTAEGGYTGDRLADYVERYGNLGFTQVGPTVVIETNAGYEVAGAERVDGFTTDAFWALDQFVIIEEDGQLRIASHKVISTV